MQVSFSNCTAFTVQECLSSQDRDSNSGTRINVVFADSINEPTGPGDFQGPSIILELSQMSIQAAHGRKLMQVWNLFCSALTQLPFAPLWKIEYVYSEIQFPPFSSLPFRSWHRHHHQRERVKESRNSKKTR